MDAKHPSLLDRFFEPVPETPAAELGSYDPNTQKIGNSIRFRSLDKRYGEKVWHGKHASGAGETEEDTMTHIYEKYCTYPHFPFSISIPIFHFSFSLFDGRA